MYFVESSTTSEIIDSRLEASVSVSSVAEALETSDIVGPRGEYVVLVDVDLPLLRTSQSFSLNVDGFVQTSDNELFRVALEEAWKEVTSLTGQLTGILSLISIKHNYM